MSNAKPFHPALVLLALIAMALLLHAPVLGLSFFSDDFSVIHRIGWQGELGTGSFFRPLPDWTLWLNFHLADTAPMSYRAVNVTLLGLNGWLVFLLCARLVPADERDRRIALIAGVLFICYPF